MKTNSNELAKISISGTHDIYFEKEHDENYNISLDHQNDSVNTQQPLSNVISITKYPSNMNYPPNNKSKYKPNAVNTATITKIFDGKNKNVHLYWTIPALTYGKIQYKVLYNQDKEEKQNNDEDSKSTGEIVTLLPHSISSSRFQIPINLSIITISIFGQQKYYSEPSESINISFNKQQKVNNATKPSKIESNEICDEPLSYFMQITNINWKNIEILLMSNLVNNKMRRTLRIKENVENDAHCINKRIVVPPNKRLISVVLDIDVDHNELYDLFLYDNKNTDIPLPRSNHIQLTILKNKNEYPPINKNYKPNCIDLATLLKVKDEKNDKVNIYWSIPSRSYGNISYKIINYANNDTNGEIVDLLPYTIPLSSIPISFQVITIANVANISYESDASKMINIDVV